MDASAPIIPANVGLTEKTLDTSVMLEELRHTLAGEAIKDVPKKVTVHDANGNPVEKVITVKEWTKVSIPLMNQEGINFVVNYVGSVLNQVVMGTNFSEEELRELEFQTDVTIIGALMMNSVKWQIDPSYAESLAMIIRNFVHAAFNRSRSGWLLEKLSTITSRVEQIEPQERKNPLLSPRSWLFRL